MWATELSRHPCWVWTPMTSMEGTGSRVGVAVRFEEGAQVGTVTVDGISHHPVDGQAGRLGALEHALGQCGFGLKGDALGDVRGEPSCQIVAPLFWQIQFAVNEGVTSGGDVGEKHADLAIFNAAGGAAILRLD